MMGVSGTAKCIEEWWKRLVSCWCLQASIGLCDDCPDSLDQMFFFLRAKKGSSGFWFWYTTKTSKIYFLKIYSWMSCANVWKSSHYYLQTLPWGLSPPKLERDVIDESVITVSGSCNMEKSLFWKVQFLWKGFAYQIEVITNICCSTNYVFWLNMYYSQKIIWMFYLNQKKGEMID